MQSMKDKLPFFCPGPQGSPYLFPPSADIQVVCAPMIVPILIVGLTVGSVLRFVAADLTADGGGGPPKDSSYFSLAHPFGQKFL